MRNEIVKTLIGLCLEINKLSAAGRAESGKNKFPSIDFGFSGHADRLRIAVYIYDWKGKEPDEQWVLYTNRKFEIEDYEEAYDFLIALRNAMYERASSIPVPDKDVEPDTGNWF